MASISRGSTKNGSYWDVRWREAGKQRRRRFYRDEFRKATVDEFLLEARRLERLGPEARRQSITVGSFIEDAWLPVTTKRVRSNTAPGFEGIQRNHIPKSLWDKDITAVTRGDLIDALNILIGEGKIATAQKLRTVLRLIWTDALDRNLVSNNVAVALPIRVPDRDVDDVEVDRASVLSIGDVRQIAASINPHFRLAVLVMGHMGLRLGEITALRRQDIDLDAGILSVRLTATTAPKRFIPNRERGHAGPPKTKAGVRDLAIPTTLMKDLREHMKALEGDRVFTMAKGGKLEPSNFRNRYFNPIVESLGLGGRTPHDLRHSAASVMLDSGMSAAAVAQYLGHANPAVTMKIYAGWFKDSSARVADAIGTAIKTVEEMEEAEGGQDSDKQA